MSLYPGHQSFIIIAGIIIVGVLTFGTYLMHKYGRDGKITIGDILKAAALGAAWILIILAYFLMWCDLTIIKGNNWLNFGRGGLVKTVNKILNIKIF